jgi:hypothetical protein
VPLIIYLVSLIVLAGSTYARMALEGAALESVWGLVVFLLAFLIPFIGFAWAAVTAWRRLARMKQTVRAAGSSHPRVWRLLWSNMTEAGQIVILVTALPVLLWGVVVEIPTAAATVREAKAMLISSPPRYRIWYSKPTGRVLHVAGELTHGIADAVAHALRANPATRLVILDSPGGLVEEGMRLAGIIRQRGLDTGVDEHCASACTFAFMGGVQRVIFPPGRLGFHGCRDLLQFVPCDSRDGRSFLIAKGVNADFVLKGLLDTAPTTIWYPSTDELIRAGVVTKVGREVLR